MTDSIRPDLIQEAKRVSVAYPSLKPVPPTEDRT